MTNQLTSNAEAMRLFFTDDIYLVNDNSQTTFLNPVNELPTLNETDPNILVKSDSKVYENKILSSSTFQEPIDMVKRKIDFKYLGQNQKNILILVNDTSNEVSSENGRKLLRNLVNAIGLNAKDFALVNYANFNFATYTDFNDYFDCKVVLSFGVNSIQLALPNQPLNQLVQLNDTKFVFTLNLHDLDSDQASKKILWSSLQKLK